MKSNPSLFSSPLSRPKALLLPAGVRWLLLVASICMLPVVGGAGPTAKAPPEEKKPALSGIELWTMNCSRCHTYRGSNEFTAAQWQNLVLHMRVRANLPAAQVREIQKFLQDGAGK